MTLTISEAKKRGYHQLSNTYRISEKYPKAKGVNSVHTYPPLEPHVEKEMLAKAIYDLQNGTRGWCLVEMKHGVTIWAEQVEHEEKHKVKTLHKHNIKPKKRTAQ